ncbi:hypothetical protein H072_11341 [Dactylellina haptotyla CBS 200.50]|uniref:Uncharacterized protein n=1 Tax=Dactylellina haptotyla (strain CBS 200.50) TaxID=1284197 RepID=S8BJ07_DACHA|nr:hypothetical protein H072_11341 [Dactylellina haptotyla CBS 200.50]
MAFRDHKNRRSISGLVPPQQPSTPVGSNFGGTSTIEKNDINGFPLAEQEKMIQRLQDLRLTVAKIEKFKPIEHEPDTTYREAATVVTSLTNDVTRLHNLIGKAVVDNARYSDIMGILPKERMEEFIARYNSLLSILLEIPSHIKFGTKTSVLSYLTANEITGFRKDFERKLARCDDLRTTIEEKITFLEECLNRERTVASDDTKVPNRKYLDPSEYDTRRRRFNTTMH